jgi:3-hydroxybutyryl-CoA dehydratase
VNLGDEFESSRRTITDADIINFAGLSGDFNPLHVDDTFAAEVSPFPGRIAHGQLVAAIGTGLRSAIDELPVASYLGATRRFRLPVIAGDTIRCAYRVAERRSSNHRAHSTVMTLEVRILNQRDEVVVDGQDVFLLQGAAE